jgi:hypothetical protein
MGTIRECNEKNQSDPSNYKLGIDRLGEDVGIELVGEGGGQWVWEGRK